MEKLKLILNKNRGWRGLAEAQLIDEDHRLIQDMIFSFSQPVWDDMLKGVLVMQDTCNYIVLHLDKEKSKEMLPKPTQQRSVLIKNAIIPIVGKEIYPKDISVSDEPYYSFKTSKDRDAIMHFIANSNKHTTSDWNCIGIRVVPYI